MRGRGSPSDLGRELGQSCWSAFPTWRAIVAVFGLQYSIISSAEKSAPRRRGHFRFCSRSLETVFWECHLRTPRISPALLAIGGSLALNPTKRRRQSCGKSPTRRSETYFAQWSRWTVAFDARRGRTWHSGISGVSTRRLHRQPAGPGTAREYHQHSPPDDQLDQRVRFRRLVFGLQLSHSRT